MTLSTIIMYIGLSVGFTGLAIALILTWILAWRTSKLWFLAAILLFPAGTSWFLIINRPLTNRVLMIFFIFAAVIVLTALVGSAVQA